MTSMKLYCNYTILMMRVDTYSGKIIQHISSDTDEIKKDLSFLSISDEISFINKLEEEF